MTGNRCGVQTTIQCVAVSLFLVCLITIGCSRKVTDRSQVIGRYEAHPTNGIEVLHLKPDGTYIESFKALTGIETTFSGRWEFEPYYGQPKVSLQDFPNRFSENSHKDLKSITLLGIEYGWDGKLRLYFSYDRDEYLSKKTN